MTTFWLSTHLGYACRHSGACCTARWPIPIERDRAADVQTAVDGGRLRAPGNWYRPAPGAPREVAGVLALQSSGACVFHRPRASAAKAPTAGGCAIHPMRPASCEHFPYVCVLDPRGVHVTLSHFCPTAANLLFDVDAPPGIVTGPPIFENGRVPEGLDARDALPPQAADAAVPPAPDGADTRGAALRTRTVPRLMSWAEVTEWEAALVVRLAADAQVPLPPDLTVFNRARRSVQEGWTWPEAPANLAEGWRGLVAPAWPRWAPVVGRYLAAKAHASWAMFLGEGPRDVASLVALARVVLQVEAVRQCGMRGQILDRAALTESIRHADLLLVHLANPARLCQALADEPVPS